MEFSKHAYLIMAHNNFRILKKLISLLDNEKNDIYVHIDLKSNDAEKDELKNYVSKSKLFIYKYYSVNWAAYSQVEVELFLLKKALNNGKYQYFHLLSGVDLPIKDQEYIYNFFKSNYPKEFVHFRSSIVSKELLDKSKYYYFLMDNSFYRKSILIRQLVKIIVGLQKLLGIDRNKNGLQVQVGANWFSITDKLAQYIILNEKKIIKQFKRTKNADEFFLQTLIINSSFIDELYIKSFNNDYHSCMRLIDWSRGRPYIFRKSDYDSIISSDFLFARKFDENVDYDIVEMIYDTLKKGNNGKTT